MILFFLILTHSVVLLIHTPPHAALCLLSLEFSFQQGDCCQSREAGEKDICGVQLLIGTFYHLIYMYIHIHIELCKSLHFLLLNNK